VRMLRAKQSPPQRPVESAGQGAVKEAAATAAAAAASVQPSASAPASAPVSPEPEKTFRAGEFLQSPSSAPGAQFLTDCEIQKSIEEASASEVDVLTELEPMAASVEGAPAQPADPRKALDGWASLQARLTRPSVPARMGPRRRRLQDRMRSWDFQKWRRSDCKGAPSGENNEAPKKESRRDAESEAALFSYIEGEAKGDADSAVRLGPRRSKAILVSALAVACVALAAMPRTRRVYSPSTGTPRMREGIG